MNAILPAFLQYSEKTQKKYDAAKLSAAAAESRLQAGDGGNDDDDVRGNDEADHIYLKSLGKAVLSEFLLSAYLPISGTIPNLTARIIAKSNILQVNQFILANKIEDAETANAYSKETKATREAEKDARGTLRQVVTPVVNDDIEMQQEMDENEAARILLDIFNQNF